MLGPPVLAHRLFFQLLLEPSETCSYFFKTIKVPHFGQFRHPKPSSVSLSALLSFRWRQKFKKKRGGVRHLPQPRSPPQLRLSPQLQRQPRSWRQPQTCPCSSFVFFSLLKLVRTSSKLPRFLTSVSSDIQNHRL